MDKTMEKMETIIMGYIGGYIGLYDIGPIGFMVEHSGLRASG